jgi:recombination protein RecT
MATTAPARRENGAGTAGSSSRTLKDALEARQTEIARALAGRVDPGAFIRVALTTVNKSSELAQCTTSSILLALLEAASLGLIPNSVMGEAYLVPFNVKVSARGEPERWEKQAVFMPGYRGLVKLARNTGVVKAVVARAVRAGDEFEVEFGLDEALHHRTDFDADDYDQKPIRYVYAVAHFVDGFKQFEVMSKAAVDKIRQRSKSKDNGPWVTDYDEMALKTIVRRLCKRLPLSDFDLARAIEADDRDVVDGSLVSESGAALPRETRTERLVSRLSGSSETESVGIDAAAREVAEDESSVATSTTAGDASRLTESEQRLITLITDTKKGDAKKPAAPDADRERLTDLASTLAGGGEPGAADHLRGLIEDPALSAVQSRKILLFAEDAKLVAAQQVQDDEQEQPAAAPAGGTSLFG